jgi:DNA replication protein
MDKFNGFTSSETFTQIPDSLFRLFNEIKDADELKVTLYTVWRIEHIDGMFRSLCESDFDAKELGLSKDEIASGLKKAIQRGTLIQSKHEADTFYFLNSPRGRAAADAFAKGDWRGSAQAKSVMERPNIFKMYEENIGPLTPLIADALRDAEDTYSSEWIADAIELAVKNNKRSWKYCEAILKRWKEEGRAEKQNRRDDQASRQRDVEGKIKKFIGG